MPKLVAVALFVVLFGARRSRPKDAKGWRAATLLEIETRRQLPRSAEPVGTLK
jgi:hypothetical protein